MRLFVLLSVGVGMVTVPPTFVSAFDHDNMPAVVSLAVKSRMLTAEQQRRRLRALDMFHTKMVENFTSPIKTASVSSFLESELDLDAMNPIYARRIFNYFNSQYTTQVAIDEEGNSFQLIIDTGSGTTLLNDVRCASEGCKTRKAVDTSRLPSYRPLHVGVEIAYAKGGVRIELGAVDFFIQSQRVTGMEFGSIISESAVFGDASYDGILGLSYPELADGTVPFFDRLLQLNVLPRGVFSVFLSRGGGGDASRLFLGGYEASYFRDPLIYHPVVRKSWWTLGLDAVLLNGEDTKLCAPRAPCEIIMDTGASLMAAPPAIFGALISRMSEGADCMRPETFPTITFVIGGEHYALEPFEYLLSDHANIQYEKGANELCSIGFSIFDVDVAEVWIAGDIFLSKYFSVYDRDHDRVGLALAVPPPV